MPRCQKKKVVTRDKTTQDGVDVKNESSGNRRTGHSNYCPKTFKSRLLNPQRPGCSSDDCVFYPPTIYLPDGEQDLPKNCQLFAMDDGCPPPNCNPFDSGASFTCLSLASNGSELHHVFGCLASSAKFADYPHWSEQAYIVPSKDKESPGQPLDCRKLANGCFCSHWSPYLYHFTQQPNPVVYVPKNGNCFSGNPVSPSSEDALSHSKDVNSLTGWRPELRRNLAGKHSFSSVSTDNVGECTHSTVLSLHLSDSEEN